MTGAAAAHDRTLIDWLTVTHDDRAHLAKCLRGPVERMKCSMRRFNATVRDGHGTMLASGGPEPRPHMLIMSGQPLDAWRAEGPIRDLIVHLTQQDVHCTRLDLARDTAGPWTPRWLQEHIESDRYVSRWKRFYYKSGKGNAGLTVECGSRQSDFMLRCYDKKAEREAAGEACPFERLSRWELELTGEQAALALYRIATVALELDEETGAEEWPLRPLHSAWLGRRLRLTIDPVKRRSNNQSDAPLSPEWDAFLADAADDILAPELDERSPAQQAHEVGKWAVRTFATTLAMVYDVGGMELVHDLIGRGRERTSAKLELIRSRAAETLPALEAAIRQIPR